MNIDLIDREAVAYYEVLKILEEHWPGKYKYVGRFEWNNEALIIRRADGATHSEKSNVKMTQFLANCLTDPKRKCPIPPAQTGMGLLKGMELDGLKRAAVDLLGRKMKDHLIEAAMWAEKKPACLYVTTTGNVTYTTEVALDPKREAFPKIELVIDGFTYRSKEMVP